MSEKKSLKDLRGGQSKIARLAKFYKVSFIHMLFNRILAIYSIPFGLFMLYSTLSGFQYSFISKALVIILWFLITPQFFESVKGLCMSATRGASFGRLNQEYAALIKKRYMHSLNLAFYSFIPYAALAIWILSLIAIGVWWV